MFGLKLADFILVYQFSTFLSNQWSNWNSDSCQCDLWCGSIDLLIVVWMPAGAGPNVGSSSCWGSIVSWL